MECGRLLIDSISSQDALIKEEPEAVGKENLVHGALSIGRVSYLHRSIGKENGPPIIGAPDFVHASPVSLHCGSCAFQVTILNGE